MSKTDSVSVSLRELMIVGFIMAVINGLTAGFISNQVWLSMALGALSVVIYGIGYKRGGKNSS